VLIAPAPRQPVSREGQSPGRDRRTCCDGQAGISVHADETVAVDDARALARETNWVAFELWPESWLAEADVAAAS
jgi:hypothetical protein